MTSHSSGPSGSRKSIRFAYGSQSRRYSKVVSNWTGSAWTRALRELYLYDGWNLLGAINGTNNSIIRSFLWGLDLSGSSQGAGGVGGLICFKQHSGSSAGTHFAAYDGNGNLMALVDGKTGSTSARYECDPFGQTIRASGTMAMLNPVRFSSKCVDDETDLSYYGYRYLNPNMGRWLNRDPASERGGRNLQGFLNSSPPSKADVLGMVELELTEMYGDIPGYLGQTTYEVPTDVGCTYQVQNCGWFSFCRKLTSVSCQAKITIIYQNGTDPEYTPPDLLFTTREHECAHAEHGFAYAIRDESVLNEVKERCVSARCMSAIQNYISAERSYSRLLRDLQDEALHIADYRDAPDGECPGHS